MLFIRRNVLKMFILLSSLVLRENMYSNVYDYLPVKSHGPRWQIGATMGDEKKIRRFNFQRKNNLKALNINYRYRCPSVKESRPKSGLFDIELILQIKMHTQSNCTGFVIKSFNCIVALARNVMIYVELYWVDFTREITRLLQFP